MIVTNNLWQFDNKNYREMCSNIGIKAAFSSSFHPQANVQVKVANKIFKYNLKTWLYKHKRAWVDELPDILWAYQTTLRIGTRETSFSLAFGADANNPVEIGGLTSELNISNRKIMENICDSTWIWFRRKMT